MYIFYEIFCIISFQTIINIYIYKQTNYSLKRDVLYYSYISFQSYSIFICSFSQTFGRARFCLYAICTGIQIDNGEVCRRHCYTRHCMRHGIIYLYTHQLNNRHKCSIICVAALLVGAYTCALLNASCLSLHPILIEEADRVATPEVS